MFDKKEYIMFVIESGMGLERTIYGKVIKYETKEEAEKQLPFYHYSWKAKVVEYDPQKHKDEKSKVNIGD